MPAMPPASLLQPQGVLAKRAHQEDGLQDMGDISTRLRGIPCKKRKIVESSWQAGMISETNSDIAITQGM